MFVTSEESLKTSKFDFTPIQKFHDDGTHIIRGGGKGIDYSTVKPVE